MNKSDLLKNIAETAYNVGYAAKKHFATYDVTSKAPGTIGFLSAAVGVFSLLVEFTSKKYLSAAFIVLGIMGIRISMWDHKKESFSEAGRNLTALFNRLKSLYFNVKAADEAGMAQYELQLEAIQKEFDGMGRSDQMLFSDWYAHYKFFWQQQIGWIEEQKTFSLFQDKLPLSFTAAMILLIVGICAYIVWMCFC